MDLVNRQVALIKPKAPFLDWLISLPDSEDLQDLTLFQLRAQSIAYLIPEYEMIEDAIADIENNFELFFEDALEGWFTDEDYWPENRDLMLFRDWFDVEVHELVIDLCEGGIKKSGEEQ